MRAGGRAIVRNAGAQLLLATGQGGLDPTPEGYQMNRLIHFWQEALRADFAAFCRVCFFNYFFLRKC